ncbi:hypothetical protein RRG08_023787 [Elysia crispata]|uniref:Uncharacterized protein n=1 Tax=Elysia crispata TaxID=231223 RepID=A0AAE0ZVP5_9GAST|nr:hypothetical protein RRG08_023787 [Elysia crispata]
MKLKVSHKHKGSDNLERVALGQHPLKTSQLSGLAVTGHLNSNETIGYKITRRHILANQFAKDTDSEDRGQVTSDLDDFYTTNPICIIARFPVSKIFDLCELRAAGTSSSFLVVMIHPGIPGEKSSHLSVYHPE